MNFKTNIGLETHFELNTKSKIFSPAPVKYGDEVNADTNVIDWAYPGTLPTINRQVVADGVKAAIALHAKIDHHPRFDRKNYFYPDNPKAYQITQFDRPTARNGYLMVKSGGKEYKIRIHEMHIEEDAGKNSHGIRYSYVDLNRQGTPLIEIVSEPDIPSPQVAYDYIKTLRKVIMFTGISNAKMEQGNVRADTNVSIHPIGSHKLGPRAEMKNVSSFNYIRMAASYERKRQERVLMSGGKINPQTRRLDEANGKTYLERYKQSNDEYRYFPEPDLPSLTISDSWINQIKKHMPELPASREHRYLHDFGLTKADVAVLTETKQMADFFDSTVKLGAKPKMVANYLQDDVSSYLNSKQVEIQNTKLTPRNVAALLKLIAKNTISTKIAKKVFKKAVVKGKDPKAYVKAKGMVQLSDPNQLKSLVKKVMANNQQSITDYQNGKDRAKGYLVGQVMKLTRGKANPQMVNQLLTKALQK